jgi:hypothetical protein
LTQYEIAAHRNDRAIRQHHLRDCCCDIHSRCYIYSRACQKMGLVMIGLVAAYIMFCPADNGVLGCQLMDERRVGVQTCGDKGFPLYKKVWTGYKHPMWIRGRLEVRCSPPRRS